MGEQIKSFRDLRVYQELKRLHLEIDSLTRAFPRDERFELASQIRRSSNGAAAILAEGWGSRHTNIYIEAINRSMGELRETQHHIDIAACKGYVSDGQFRELDDAYEACGRMLERLQQSLSRWRDSKRTGKSLHEDAEGYGQSEHDPDWDAILRITREALDRHE